MDKIIPNHIAIVMDGNGRWAKRRGKPRIDGHQAGINSVKSTIKACVTQGVKVLSLFAFSSENWARPEQEVQFLMQLFIESLDKEVQQLHQRGIRLKFCGEQGQLSKTLQQKMQACEELTCHNEQLLLNIVINYGGKWDITQAVKQIAQDVQQRKLAIDAIDEELITSYLSTYPLPEPDLFIRTSGEQRISNFFLWQLAYSELYFSPVMWPDFDEEHFNLALAFFANRERRYGTVFEDEITNV